MRYVPHTEQDRTEMLRAIGAGSVEELFAPVPKELRPKRPLDVGPALTEPELQSWLEETAARDHSAADLLCFAGGGFYDRFIPAAIDALVSRGEFLTSYTPYQPECSQGTLQYLYEYQTMMAELTGLPVSNASLYEGATACAEAMLLSWGLKETSRRVVVSAAVHPHYRRTLETYARPVGLEVVTVPAPGGLTDAAALRKAATPETLAVLVQQPNFFGAVEDVPSAVAAAHAAGAQAVVAADPVALALLEAPGAQGADIVVGEGQPLGCPLAFGGPTFGFFCVREEHVRKLPGRLVGETHDTRGRRAFVLTFQTREQHIRREKATSNICTSQSLYALRAAIYLSLLGPAGLREVAALSVRKAHALAEQAAKIPGFALEFPKAPFAFEFALRCPRPADEVVAAGLKRGVLAGIPLGPHDPALRNVLLVAVTERRTAADLDRFVEALR